MNTEDSPGTLIAVEGLDGSGKTTQVRLLYSWLAGLGCKVFFSEWNSSDIVRGATKRGKKKQLLTSTTFSLIHATDFADRYERQIRPMLRGGYVVLCDRYVFTSFARDRVRGCDAQWLKELYSFARVPDIVYYFRVPLNIALNRILEGRTKLKYHEAGMDLGLAGDLTESFRIFQGKVMEQYDRMADEFGFTVIDATRRIPDQQEIVRAFFQERVDLARFRQKARR